MGDSVVCGIDGSNAAREAARVAEILARGLGYRLVLAHVARVPGGARALGETPTVHDYDELRAVEQRRAEEFAAEVTEELGLSGTAARRVEFGDPAETLAWLADEEDAALVVVGSRGHGPVKAAVLGSVSSEVAARAPCPVVVVPPGTSVRAP